MVKGAENLDQAKPRFGPYVVLEKLAAGGMAEVYRVHHVSEPHVYYALKRVRPDSDEIEEYRKMMLDEARIASKLIHPNISQVVDALEVRGELALIMQYVNGFDLARVRRLAPEAIKGLSTEAAVYVVRAVLSALDYAHNARDDAGRYVNVIHRDVSAANVMLDRLGQVRLVDFGIARAKERLSKTQVGNVKGKFRYMAPEQIRGKEVTLRSDIYSAALLLWELLSGTRIHQDASIANLMLRTAKGRVPTLSSARKGLPEALVHAYIRATQVQPGKRFTSARAFADALDASLDTYVEAHCRKELGALVRAAEQGLQDLKAQHQAKEVRDNPTENLSEPLPEDQTDNLEEALLQALADSDSVEAAPPPTKSAVTNYQSMVAP